MPNAVKSQEDAMNLSIDGKLLETVRQLGPLIRKHADEGERQRRLSRPVVDAMVGARLFQLFLPRSLGGLEADPITTARVLEELSTFDSAAGWAIMLNSNQFFACRLPTEGIEEIYGSREPENFAAAAFHPPMTATVVNGGYVLNGRGPLASAVEEARWLLVVGVVMEGDQVKEAFAAYIRKSEFEIVDTWHSLGMRGTGSHDVVVKNVFVPKARTWPMQPEFEPNMHCRGPLYRFPGIGEIGVVIAPILLGIARVAIPELVELGKRKTPFVSAVPLRDRGTAQSKLGQALAAFRSGWVYFYDTISGAWAKTKDNHTFTVEERADIHLGSIHACQSSVRAVELVCQACGTSGVYTRSPLERCFRDIQTLRHQGFMSENRYETVGQVHFGLPPDLPLVLF